jgi:hypothetical protein
MGTAVTNMLKQSSPGRSGSGCRHKRGRRLALGVLVQSHELRPLNLDREKIRLVVSTATIYFQIQVAPCRTWFRQLYPRTSLHDKAF